MKIDNSKILFVEDFQFLKEHPVVKNLAELFGSSRYDSNNKNRLGISRKSVRRPLSNTTVHKLKKKHLQSV